MSLQHMHDIFTPLRFDSAQRLIDEPFSRRLLRLTEHTGENGPQRRHVAVSQASAWAAVQLEMHHTDHIHEFGARKQLADGVDTLTDTQTPR